MNSPFAHRFGTNYTPTDDELKQIRELIAQPLTQRNNLDAEISRLQAERNQLDYFITHHQALLSPIRRISPDILQEIFVRCLPTKHNSIMSHREAPLLLGRVCSHWRNLSRAIPELWSSIHISIPEPCYGAKPEGDMIFVQAITEWLDRSGALPLSISVHEAPVWHPAKVETDIFSHLTSLSGRWKHVDLSTYHPPSHLFFMPVEQFPLLESFSINPYEDTSPYPIGSVLPSACGVFQAPRLQGLLIYSSLLSTNVPISWSHLTELIVGGRTRRLRKDTALAILGHCKNLVSCTLELQPLDTFLQTESSTLNAGVTVPLLRSLAVQGGEDLGSFFNNLNLPVLLRFTFHIDSSDSTGRVFDGPQLYAFLGRLKTLDSLSLTAHSLPRKSLINCITEIPSISKLHLYFYGTWIAPGVPDTSEINHPIDDHILGLLTPTSINKPLCPALTVINCDASVVSDDVLLDFIRSRTTLSSMHNVPRLDRVAFKLPREQGDDAFLVPPEVLSEGSEVEITYYVPYSPPPRILYPWRGVREEDYYPKLTIPFGPYTS